MTGSAATSPPTSHPTSHGHRQSGVTLIEMVVALAVIALTLALAAAALRLLAHSGERGALIIARHDALSRGLDVLRRDIERLERAVAKPGGRPHFAFHGDAARLAFVAVEPPFPSEPGPYLIVYTIQQRPDGARLTRERAPFAASALDILRLPRQDAVDLIEGALRLRFLYLDRTAGGDRWLAHWPDPLRLPSLIALQIAGLDGAAMPPIVFRPRIDAEASCVEDGARTCSLGNDGALAADAAAGPGSSN
jgi:prepilin-type N-terminal cleavage/methylation domain-containing protein